MITTISSFMRSIFLLGLLIFSINSNIQAQDAVDEALWTEGRTIFRANCASCHHPVDPSTGPALLGATERWLENADYEGVSGQEWLYKWVKNNGEVLASGHTYANGLFKEWDKSVMNAFPALTNEEIDAILYYADNSTNNPNGPTISEGPAPVESSFPMKQFLVILVGGLLIIGLILARVSTNLKNIARKQEGLPEEYGVPFWKSPKLRTLVILAGVIFLGYFTVSNATATGRQEAYQPDQPIKYSHELHAGVYSIECQYCHSGANESKHSNIPSINVCMNCHKNVKEGPQHGRKEISKIYAAIGFNPNDGKYFDTEAVSKEDVANELKTYLMADSKSYTEVDTSDEKAMAKMEADVEANLATTMEMYNRPVEWVRVHNLPDHVYFNHAQHVNAGNVECQTCHGNIQEMEVVAQHAPLSMGWCINCHRETEVDLSNDYYQVYEKYHEDLKSGAMDKVTVEDIGGTECQKCHY